MRAIKNKLLVKIDTKQKERHALTEDITIYIERGFNFNLREDRGSRAEVVYADGITAGCPILIHHNATDATYEVGGVLSGEEEREGYKLLSIPEDMAFCYFEDNEWKPYKNFVISQRIFKPYKGKLVGIEPEQIKNRLYITKGEVEWDGIKEDLSGNVCVVTENSDYEIIFHTKENRPESLIRTRHRELLAIDTGMTNKIKNGEYLIGVSHSTAKKLNHDSKKTKETYQAS